MFPRSPYVQNLYDQLEGTNTVKPRHLPCYVKYETAFGPFPEGLRRHTPKPLSLLCSTLAVANSEPEAIRSFVVSARHEAQIRTETADAYETPAKKTRATTATVSSVTDYPTVPGRVIASPVLCAQIERGYEELYLTEPGSLLKSHDLGQPPPRNDSAVKVANALAQCPPRRTAGLSQQQQRVENYRRFGVQVISLAVIADDDEVAAAAA